jgi:hypothetical protein
MPIDYSTSPKTSWRREPRCLERNSKRIPLWQLPHTTIVNSRQEYNGCKKSSLLTWASIQLQCMWLRRPSLCVCCSRNDALWSSRSTCGSKTRTLCVPFAAAARKKRKCGAANCEQTQRRQADRPPSDTKFSLFLFFQVVNITTTFRQYAFYVCMHRWAWDHHL